MWWISFLVLKHIEFPWKAQDFGLVETGNNNLHRRFATGCIVFDWKLHENLSYVQSHMLSVTKDQYEKI